jgi:hypothetical protein
MELRTWQNRFKVPTTVSPCNLVLHRHLVNKTLDTKAEEAVNGLSGYNAAYGCTRYEVSPTRIGKTNHYDVKQDHTLRNIISHTEHVLCDDVNRKSEKFTPIDILLYPQIDGILVCSQNILHPYSLVFGYLKPYLQKVKFINLLILLVQKRNKTII